MAVQIDYLQALIDRGDLYDPADVATAPRQARIVGAAPRMRRRPRAVALDTVRTLSSLGVAAWTIVAVEIWLLVTR